MPSSPKHTTRQATETDTQKSTLRDSILADIHTQGITPRPRWQYILLHSGLWLSGIVTVLLGSFSVAFSILEFTLPERAYMRWIENQSWLIHILPYAWGIGVILALLLGYSIFSKTGVSYRFRAGIIISLLLVGSLVGGLILHVTHMAHWSDVQIQRLAPPYGTFRKKFILPRPEEGALPVHIFDIKETSLTGESPDRKKWTIQLACQTPVCRDKQNQLRVGRVAVFAGSVGDDGVFIAHDILPSPRGIFGPRVPHR